MTENEHPKMPLRDFVRWGEGLHDRECSLHSQARMNTRSASLFLVCVMLANLTRGQTPVSVKTDREVLLGPQSEDE